MIINHCKTFLACLLVIACFTGCNKSTENRSEELNQIMFLYEQNKDTALLYHAERLCDSLELCELTKKDMIILNLRKPQVLIAMGRIRDAFAWKCQHLPSDNMDQQTSLQFAQIAFCAGKEDLKQKYSTRTLDIIDKELTKSEINNVYRQQLLSDKLQVLILLDEYEQSKEVATEIGIWNEDEFKTFYNATRKDMLSLQTKYALDTLSHNRDIYIPHIP